MRIVHLIARLNDGGPARVIAALASALAPVGQTHRVLSGACETDEADLSRIVTATGTPVETVPHLRRTPGLHDLAALAWIADRLRAMRPDVVHTHTAKAGALGRLACRILGLPCVHTYHGHVLHGYFPPLVHAALAAWERTIAGTHHHHALTASQHRDLHVTHGVGRAERWHVLPVPVPPVAATGDAAALTTALPGRPCVLFLGRLVPVKDAGLWLRTFAELCAQTPDVHGLICGDGGERSQVAAEAEALRQRGARILMPGSVPAGDAFACADVLLMTSRNEGLPLAAVEAMGAGIPVVAPPVGGLADLAAAGAVIAAPRQPQALAAAVLSVLRPGPQRSAAIARGRAYAAALHPTALAPAYARMYQQVARELPVQALGDSSPVLRTPDLSTSRSAGR